MAVVILRTLRDAPDGYVSTRDLNAAVDRTYRAKKVGYVPIPGPLADHDGGQFVFVRKGLQAALRSRAFPEPPKLDLEALGRTLELAHQGQQNMTAEKFGLGLAQLRAAAALSSRLTAEREGAAVHRLRTLLTGTEKRGPDNFLRNIRAHSPTEAIR